MVLSDARAPSSDRREQLLQVAQKIFAERGYQATTMDDLAAAAGFTKPILYQHFSSKEALYNEIVQSMAQHLLQELGAATQGESTPRGMVEAAFRAYFTIVVNQTDVFRLLFLQAPIGDHAKEIRRVESLVTSFIETFIPLESDPRIRRQIAASIVGMAEGAATSWLLQQEASGWPTPQEGEIDRMAAAVASLAWGGLRTMQID